MIRSLSFRSFGRFENRTFELAPVTLVFGPNEAGKTTFFDGLFQALCKPSEAKKAGKALKERYGAGRQAAADVADLEPIGDEEFLSLYAIRAGDLNFRLDLGTDWMERLKARLFHGGLDPAALAAEFQKRSSDSRAVAVNKELEKAREAADKARGDLERLRREREGHLSREREVAEMEASLEEARARAGARREESARLEKELEAEEAIARRQMLAAEAARWEEAQALEAEARGLAGFAEDRRPEFEELARASRRLADALLAARGKREQCAQSLAEARSEARAAREAAESAGPRSALARRLAAEARSAAAGSGGGPGAQGWALAAGLALAGGAAGLFAHGTAAWAPALAGLAAAAGALLAFHRVRAVAALRSRAAALGRCRDEWIAAQGADAAALPGSVDGFAAFMDERSRDKDAAEALAADAARRCESRQADWERAEAETARLKDQEDAARRAERDWLHARGVETFEEYERRVRRAAQVEAELRKRREALAAAAGGQAPEARRAEVLRKLRDLDEGGVPATGLDEASLQRLRNRLAALRREREEESRREAELIDRKAGAAGEIRGALGKLAGEIVEAEDRLARAEDAIRRLELDKRAAALACALFRELAQDADSALDGLSREIAGTLSRILPEGRSVSLAGLGEDRIQASDAGGAARALPALSTGTQHALALAARLALARRHRDGPGLLVLDEPFLAMDTGRETRALEMVLDFQRRHGWQIILLTKEAALKDKVLSLHAEARVIELRPAGDPIS